MIRLIVSMALGLLFTGLVTGLSIAAPIGPIGLLCIRRTLAGGRRQGIASGLGAATADFTYGLVAAFGLTAVSDTLTGGMAWLRLAGGLFLLGLGVKITLSKPLTGKEEALDGLLGDYASALALTLANPMTILSFAAVFAGLGLPAGGSISPGSFALGIFLGSLTWWLILCGCVDILRSKLDDGAMLWINRISGMAIAGFGLWALGGLIHGI